MFNFAPMTESARRRCRQITPANLLGFDGQSDGGFLLTEFSVALHLFRHTDLIKSRLNLESKDQQ
jgi:hypothetical protein